MAQGFVRDLNLIESDTGTLDRGILDNLGGPNITTDLLLFDGNTKFISKIQTAHYSYDSSADVITVTGEGKVAFSDGTKISFGDSPTEFIYEVHSSNGIDKFRVRNSLGQVVAPVGDLRRNDTVTAENLSNLSVKRLETNPSASTGVSADDGAADLFNEYSSAEQGEYINSQLALYYYKRERVPLTYEDSSFDQRVSFRGSVMIVDNDATVSTQPNDTTPGLFIVDASNPGSDAVRAFSDASNPWTETGSALEMTDSNVTNSQPNTLKLNPFSNNVPNFQVPSNLLVAESNSLTSSESDPIFKLPVIINGETFFLLLKT